MPEKPTQTELLAQAYASNPRLPKAGDIIMNYGYEFTVTEPMVHEATGSHSAFTHQFTYTGICTSSDRNESIRHTSYNGGRYGWGINLH